MQRWSVRFSIYTCTHAQESCSQKAWLDGMSPSASDSVLHDRYSSSFSHHLPECLLSLGRNMLLPLWLVAGPVSSQTAMTSFRGIRFRDPVLGTLDIRGVKLESARVLLCSCPEPARPCRLRSPWYQVLGETWDDHIIVLSPRFWVEPDLPPHPKGKLAVQISVATNFRNLQG